MSVIFLLIPLSVIVAALFLGAFVWAVRTGQYDDTCTPALRLLSQDSPLPKNLPANGTFGVGQTPNSSKSSTPLRQDLSTPTSSNT